MLLGATRRSYPLVSFAARPISGGFPKHNELFADDYYDAQADQSNAYDKKHKQNFGKDMDQFNQANNRVTPTGVLSSYKKQLNLNAKDIMERDHWESMRTLRDDFRRELDATDKETFTKEFAMRLRLKRDRCAPYPHKGEEYGDYQKFEKNYVEQV